MNAMNMIAILCGILSNWDSSTEENVTTADLDTQIPALSSTIRLLVPPTRREGSARKEETQSVYEVRIGETAGGSAIDGRSSECTP